MGSILPHQRSWGVPGEGIGLERVHGAVAELQEAKLAEVCNEDESVVVEIAASLRFVLKSVEVVVGRLDSDRATLGICRERWLGREGCPAHSWKEATIGYASAGVDELGVKYDGRLETLKSSVSGG